MDAGENLRFGRFEFRPKERMLLAEGSPVSLGSRAFDILCVLVEEAGRFVTKEELVAKVWPTTFVVDGNLRVHMAGLRKALGDGRDGQRFIVNVPNRGYSFVAAIEKADTPSDSQVDAQSAAEPEAPSLPAPLTPLPPRLHYRSLPTPLHRIVGRDQAAATLRTQVREHRLVTVVGAGGIGKTTLAVSVVANLMDRPAQSPWAAVHFIDLALLSDPSLVASSLTSALGLTSVVGDAVPSLLAFLHDKRLLILFDNCEHVVAEVATLAEAILRGAPSVHILATSREPLRADGERVHHLLPLTVPRTGQALTTTDAMSYSAIELFVERALGSTESFELREHDLPVIAEICRRLDGLPLALELAAPRVEMLGVKGLATALDDRFAFLSKGRRTALPRHQTLRAALDWSFDLLDERDRQVLTLLSIFAGPFTLDAACAVAAGPTLSTLDIVDSLSDLVARSLVAADVSYDETRFRLLESTRVYARDKLMPARQAPGQEATDLARRHLAYCLERLAWGDANWPTMPVADWLAGLGPMIDDVRAALAWAFSPHGDERLGIELTARAGPLFFQLSLSDEYRQRAERAIERISATPVPAAVELQLLLTFGYVVFHTLGLRQEMHTVFDRGLELAGRSGDSTLLAYAYSAKWMGAYNAGQPAQMLHYAELFEALTKAKADPVIALMYDRMKCPGFHCFGDQRSARGCADRSLQAANIRTPFLMGSQIDRRISIGTLLGRILWLQGEFQAAEDRLGVTLEIAREEGEGVAYGFSLGFSACPVALLNGDYAVARERIAVLLRHTAEHSLAAWRLWGTYYEQYLAGIEDAAEWRRLVDRVQGEAPPPHLTELLAVFHPELASPSAFARSADGTAAWATAELMRQRALQIADPAAAEEALRRSMALARQNDALVFELRGATSLARLLAGQQRQKEAATLLGDTLARLTDPKQTPDVVAAKELLGSI